MKISDFKISEIFLRKICEDNNVIFKDLLVSFDGEGIKDNTVCLDDPQNIGQTLYEIIKNYIVYSENIVGKDLVHNVDEFLLTIATLLRSMIFSDYFWQESVDQELHLTNLYQYLFPWILMKDIVCPAYDTYLKNVRVVHGETPYVDCVKFFDENELKEGNYPHIFINTGFHNKVLQDSYMTVCALEAHGLNPMEIIPEIFNSCLYERFVGLVKLSMKDDQKVNSYLSSILSILGLDISQFYMVENTMSDSIELMKNAQSTYWENAYDPLNWWYLGIIEKMLAPAHGPDWSPYYALQPYVEEFWNKVEEIKEKRQKNKTDAGVPFEILLRVKQKQTQPDPVDNTVTLQRLLSSDRIWR